jgi:acyl transferase domain-containing protein/NADPH:quinone reductase-like Zn-dependent oxidoreductase/acyl carrier protein/SAM-dependent methyltransferase
MDLLRYVLGEAKNKRINKADAANLIRQLHAGWSAGVQPVLHPLLHTNTSDLDEQRFTSFFDGTEFLFADHVVRGSHILPGVAYLEMARAALERACGTAPAGEICLKHVVWARPVMDHGIPQYVHIRLDPQENGEIAYEIYGDGPGGDGEPVLYGRGVGAIVAAIAPGRHDIDQLRDQCTRTLDREQCYALLKQRGVACGPRLQSLETVKVAKGHALARLRLPADAHGDYVLHPSIMDGAVQATIGFLSAEDNDGRMLVPFAIDCVEVLHPCKTAMWAVLRVSEAGSGSQNGRLDIDVCDDDGVVCVRMKGLSSRELAVDLAAPGAQRAPSVMRCELWTPAWSVVPAPQRAAWPDLSERVAIVGGTAMQQAALLACHPAARPMTLSDIEADSAAGGGIDHVVWIAPEAAGKAIDDRLIAAQQQGVLACLRLVKGLLKLGYGAKPLGWTIVTEGTQAVVEHDAVAPAHASVHGFVGSMAKEYPNWKLRLADLQPGAAWPCAALFALPADPMGNAWAWRQGLWYRQQLLAAEAASAGPSRCRQGGVYVVIGGAGGIGEVWSEHMVRTYGAHIVWIGRRARDAGIDAKLERLAALGPAPHYIAADAGDHASLQAAYDEIRQRHGRVDGVVHAAIVLADKSLANIDEAQFQAALSAKVDVSVRMAQVFGAEALDFVLFFSSVQSTFKAPGQSNYAAGCTFKDAFAQRLRADWKCAVKVINWGYWGGVGAVAAPAYRERMAQMGVGSIEPQEGMAALETLLNGPLDQIGVLKLSKPLSAFGIGAADGAHVMEGPVPAVSRTRARDTVGVSPIDDADALEKVKAMLARMVSKLVRIAPGSQDGDADLSAFGFDSISLTEFVSTLNRELGISLSPPVLFEYPTLNAIAAYLVTEHADAVAARFAPRGSSVAPTATATATADGPGLPAQTTRAPAGRRRARLASDKTVVPASVAEREAVAIVGMSGRFPMAEDIDALWRNLSEGRDCISEIPQDRWDWREYYGDPVREDNKTNVKWGGFIDGIRDFDPLFFGISPREAELMDPQQRLLMIHAWKAIEDAGYAPASLTGSDTALFIGTSGTGYADLVAQANTAIEGYTSTGSVASVGPNRLSFLLNLHGPSEPVETACSSALVALRRGVLAIEAGESKMAIVGGVNTIVTPGGHIAFGKSGMLSEDGRCKAFSDKANGYVRGEGVGILVLKRLSDAEQAGDHIYGVIRSTAENHGGRANAFTAPNPKAQAALLVDAYARGGIDPRSVGYIEAHGTGTSLGDPVEINGLKSAFKELYRASGNGTPVDAHCGLGTVKSNIGHLELAAGAAGVIKVLLQLKHKTLVKSLHCDTLNPYIALEGSPFYVVRENRAWEAPRDAQGNALPRRAGVSSFGFGGVNAHVVIEEYVPKVRAATVAVTPERPALVVLSAKNHERLREQAQQLLSWIERSTPSAADLADLAYTLQVGRDAMDSRLALIAGSMESLVASLSAFLGGEEHVDELYRGEIKHNKDALATFAADDDMARTIDAWVAKGKYGKLLDLWVKGLSFDWTKLYGETRPQRISLPTYPFARECYWVPHVPAQAAAPTQTTDSAVLHPLLHRNTSDLNEQRFSTTFKGNEFFLADHVVQGKKVLPGVAYLEMARAALQHSVAGQAAGSSIHLKHVVWSRPLSVGEAPEQVHIALSQQDDGEIAYEIYGDAAGQEDAVVYGQGIGRSGTDTTVSHLDIAALRAGCTKELDVAGFYRLLGEAGVDYGARFQALRSLSLGQRQVLARLDLPAGAQGQYVLHPSMMDGALQAAIALFLAEGDKGGLALPFALESLEAMGACEPSMWVLAQYSAGSSAGNPVFKLDIDICREDGSVCVRMQGLSLRALATKAVLPQAGSRQALPDLPAPAAPAAPGASTMLAPVWDAAPPAQGAPWPTGTACMAIVGGTDEQQAALLARYPEARLMTPESIQAGLTQEQAIDHVVWIAPAAPAAADDDGLIAAQEQGVLACLRLVKSLLELGYGARPLGWTFITEGTQAVLRQDQVLPAHASVHGLVGSMAKEYPNWKVRLADLQPGAPWPYAELFALPSDPMGNAWAWRQGQWYRQQLLAAEVEATGPTRYRQGGIYVVIGGAGGIGEVWSEYMVRTYGAHIVWIGRRARDEAIDAKLERLAALGPAPHYIAADAGDRASLQAAYDEIRQRHGRVDGVVHAAIVLADRSLAQIDEAQFKSALSAKVDVSVRLAQVFGAEALDFVLFFSSMQSSLKAPGQSNYAAGCTFKDAFAQRLRADWKCAVKVVNWGYWGSVGVVASPAYRERMAQMGVGSIEPTEGMAALETLLNGPFDQLGVLKLSKPLSALGIVEAERLQAVGPAGPADPGDLHGRIGTAPGYAGADRQVALVEALELHFCQLLYGQLRATGLFDEPTFAVGQASARIGLPSLYRRWLDESLNVLARRGWLEYDGQLCTLAGVQVPPLVEAWQQWEASKGGWLADDHVAAQVRLVELTLRALPAILSGRAAATEVMFPNSSMALVEGIYKHNPIADYFNGVLADTLVACVQERVRQDPAARIRILEVGAGTGGTSALLFERLRPYQAHIEEYCYTDLSRAFLWHAEQTYGPGNPYLSYRIFDVSKPLAQQGIGTGRYDLVVATNVLHATANIRQSLRNAKAALRANGLMLLNEISANHLFAHLTFGLLEGWWLYEDAGLRIPGGPGLYPASWQAVLEEEGYRSVLFPARLAHGLGQQIVVAESDGIIRQIAARAQTDEAAAATLPAARERAARKAQAVRPGAKVTDQMIEDHVRGVVLECVGAALKMDVARIEDDRSFAEYGLDSILAVNLVNMINDRFGFRLPTTVLFDHNSVDSMVGHIIADHKTALSDQLQGGAGDEAPGAAEVRTGSHPVPAPGRAGRARFGRRAGQPEAVRTERSAQPAGQASYHRVLIERPGHISDLKLVEQAVPALKDDEVRISVRAFSLNFADLLCVSGLYPTMPPYPFTAGLEVSGVVVAVGAAVAHLRKGQEVLAFTGKDFGGHATMVTCDAGLVFDKPATLSFEQACALPAVALTMIDAFRKGQVRKGEKILIQTAAGGTGLLAVQLAQHHGAEIYATAGSQHKLDHLGALNVPHLINYVENDFEAEVKRLTGGEGVDVVINTLPGEAMQKGLNCLAPGGRYIEIAMAALKSARAIDLSVLSNNQSFFSVDLGRLLSRNRELLQEYIGEMFGLVEQGVIRPVIGKVFPFEAIQEAHRWLGDRKNIGKVVVRISDAYRYEEAQAALPAGGLSPQTEAIAIIGMSGRFAQSPDLETLWAHLADGDDLTGEVTRWDLSRHIAGDAYCRRAALLQDIDQFDPLFFNISGREAIYMDPQQRLFLEESWSALEDAGYAGAGVEGRRCGIYVGCAVSDYSTLFGDAAPAQSMWGNSNSLIPARLAYHLNLQGPAVAIDTACSSSLVAIHIACQGLRAGETDLALAGGVSIQSTHQFHVSATSAGMLSPSGRCHTFDDRADGFVPGEGVGVVVLKRLSHALADGDHVYGVIRGSAINQDGATNGITAPSALSQERLETEVYEKFGVDPAQIQMVEAHGTGTKLGDPIEYRALTRAFRTFTDKRQYCAIGSIKTNLGHTVGAAGVAGVLKILLALKHKKIPPSLHFEKGNSNIAFEDSPFFVNTTLREWQAEPGARRCAAVSSFGFSGTNAHLVIEEAPAPVRERDQRAGHLIVVSARSAAQLRQQVRNLLACCERTADLDCGDLSHTLLLGRRHFGHRLACVVRSRDELLGLLGKWLETGKLPQMYVGEIDGKGRREQASLKRYGNDCIEQCRHGESDSYLDDLATIAELHVQGYALNFERLFAAGGYRRLPLPTYPFARERYWVTAQHSAAPALASSVLHPLVHENTSNLDEQRFSTTLSGQEFFLADHVVRGRKVMPAVAYLEMAREALRRAMQLDMDEPLGLRDVVWAHPLTMEERSEQVHIGLYPQDGGEIAYEIYGLGADGERVAYGQGVAMAHIPVLSDSVDIAALRAQCPRVLGGPECYGLSEQQGIACGPRFQALQTLHVGEGLALAKLERPAGAQGQFVLHPSMMDGALLAANALLADRAGANGCLPFTLEALEVNGACTASMWALVRHGAAAQAGPGRKYDIALCDEDGKMVVRMTGLTMGEPDVGAEAVASPAVTAAAAEAGVMFVPVWDAATAPQGAPWPTGTACMAIVGGTDEQQAALLARYPEARLMTPESIQAGLTQEQAIDHVVWIAPAAPAAADDDGLIAAQEQGVLACLRLVKSLLELGYGARPLGWTFITEGTQAVLRQDQVLPAHASVHGLVGSMAKEYPNWKVRLADLQPGAPWPYAELFALPGDPMGNAWAWRQGQWYRQQLLAAGSRRPDRRATGRAASTS